MEVLMIDIDFLRTHAHLYRQAILAKGIPLDLDRLLAVDRERRQADAHVNRLRAERNRMTYRKGAGPSRSQVE
jgi:seryl-tRNA synthetase